MPYLWRQKVLFKHCDPAGIVFYPRYFEMINDCVEAFFFDLLEYPFEDLASRKTGVPTVQIEATFSAISRHGDWLDFALHPLKIGKSSFSFELVATADNERVMSAKTTIVHVYDHVSAPWPPHVRDKISEMIGDPR